MRRAVGNLEVHRAPARSRPGRGAIYIGDYWIVNLVEHVTDVRRVTAQETVTPLAALAATIVAADLLP